MSLAEARNNPVWNDIQLTLSLAGDWYGLTDEYHRMGFNLLGVENGTEYEVSRKNNALAYWGSWIINLKNPDQGMPSRDHGFTFNDDRNPTEHYVPYPKGIFDPRGSGSGTGPQPGGYSSSSASGAQPPPPPPPKEEPKSWAQQKSYNTSRANPPPPAIFSEDSLSANEDDKLVTTTSEWEYPKLRNFNRKLKIITKAKLGRGKGECVIPFFADLNSFPAGAFDESCVPRAEANNIVDHWEMLLRRTTVYLCVWAGGIVSPKVLRNYMEKNNEEWVKLKLYRYVYFEGQANHLGVFLTPRTFALATCTEKRAIEKIRKDLKENIQLPPAKALDPQEMLLIRNEGTIVITDLPFRWLSNSRNLNDISTAAETWGWTNIQHYSPGDYGEDRDYLDQPCKVVKTLISEDDTGLAKSASIHIWISLIDYIDYKGSRGNVRTFKMKEQSQEMTTYFLRCFASLLDAGGGFNQIVININAEADFVNCAEREQFRRVAKDLVDHLRGEGYMASLGGPMWREVHTFVDGHGRIDVKGYDAKMTAMALLEKQLYREKTLLKCMFHDSIVTKAEKMAIESEIAKNEGLIDDPPTEYSFEEVGAVPLDPSSRMGQKMGKKVKSRMHVPNWGDQPKTSSVPTLVFDQKFFWTEVPRQDQDPDEEDPLWPLKGICDGCSMSAEVDRGKYEGRKSCPNCSANYSLRSFSDLTAEDDRRLRIYLAVKAASMYEKDEDWSSFDINNNLMSEDDHQIVVGL